MLGGKGAIATKAGKWTITGGEGTIRTSPDVWRHCILWVIKEYKNIIKNKPRFNGGLLMMGFRNNLPTIQDRVYMINLDEHKSVGTHWIALYISDNNVNYFDSFGVEHIPQVIKKFIGNKNIKTNIYRIKANDSIICGYFCTGFLILW